MNNVIRFSSPEEDAAAFREFFERQKRVDAERVKAAVIAVPALKRLCKVMCERSGQVGAFVARLVRARTRGPEPRVHVLVLSDDQVAVDVNELLRLHQKAGAK